MGWDLNALEDEGFRRTLRAWIEAIYPASLRHPRHRLHWPEVRDWWRTLYEKGWIAPAWPREWGGMGLSASKQVIYIEEMERWGVARMPDHGLTMVGPTIMRHGSEAQKRRFLPPTLSGEMIWAQGYSEPNAGSDLAALQCAATRDGEDYVVDGAKTWTTLAMDASWIYLLVRTSREGRKRDGITFLLADLSSPGIAIRPIRNLAGHDEFAEVFFDKVRVPVANRIGPENGGWTIAKAQLGFERIFIGSPRLPTHLLGRLRTVAGSLGRLGDPVFRERYTRLALDVADLTALYEGFVEQVRRGEDLGPEVSMLKIVATETGQRITELMLETAAEHGMIWEPQSFEGEMIDPATLFLNARPTTIYGGSNEIQRGILAKRVLGLTT
jgi:alkylation response protein AidB-like acyl-CoA dehydrogenase